MSIDCNKIDIDMDMELDKESVMSSVTDLSIYHEFDQMIAELHSIQNTHNQLIEHFYHLSTSINSTSNNDSEDDTIIITYNNDKINLDNLLEIIYNESMERIKSGGKMEFGNLLLDYLKKVSF